MQTPFIIIPRKNAEIRFTKSIADARGLYGKGDTGDQVNYQMAKNKKQKKDYRNKYTI